ncbi:unnamed protein product [Cuscuta europaea]|uniref:Uncharacterized protein n=1 Tax=Cuscuta europaea TaxID=41803 RepID=A0A9P1DXB2_CUSEU|nr:unnamed protein product [Cuscuta europaea]
MAVNCYLVSVSIAEFEVDFRWWAIDRGFKEDLCGQVSKASWPPIGFRYFDEQSRITSSLLRLVLPISPAIWTFVREEVLLRFRSRRPEFELMSMTGTTFVDV